MEWVFHSGFLQVKQVKNAHMVCSSQGRSISQLCTGWHFRMAHIWSVGGNFSLSGPFKKKLLTIIVSDKLFVFSEHFKGVKWNNPRLPNNWHIWGKCHLKLALKDGWCLAMKRKQPFSARESWNPALTKTEQLESWVLTTSRSFSTLGRDQ